MRLVAYYQPGHEWMPAGPELELPEVAGRSGALGKPGLKMRAGGWRGGSGNLVPGMGKPGFEKEGGRVAGGSAPAGIGNPGLENDGGRPGGCSVPAGIGNSGLENEGGFAEGVGAENGGAGGAPGALVLSRT